METEPQSNDVAPTNETILDGSWERRGRSITAAAVFALLLVGAIYANGGAILSTIAIVIGHVSNAGTESAAVTGSLESMAHQAEISKVPLRLALVISQFLLMLIPTLLIVRSWHSSRVSQYIRFGRSSLKDVALAVATGIFFFPLNIAMASYFIRKLNIPEPILRINEALFTSYSTVEFVWLIVVVCVTPSICEEVFFRGCVQRTFERTMGWWSIVLTGFLFGLYHLQPLGLFNLSGLGFLMGMFYFVSKNLLPSMALHFTNNFLVTLSLFIPLRVFGVELNGLEEIPWWMILGSTTLLLVVLMVLYRARAATVALEKKSAEASSN